MPFTSLSSKMLLIFYKIIMRRKFVLVENCGLIWYTSNIRF